MSPQHAQAGKALAAGFEASLTQTGDGVLVWRVEAFQPVRVPDAQVGLFYSGDSYIVLSKRGEARDVFTWLGHESSLDEQGAAALLAVNLDDALGGAPVQHREEQGSESPQFFALFKHVGGVQHRDGGVASGFHHVEAEAPPTALLHVKGRRSVLTRQVRLSAASLNEGDVFVLDAGFTLYLWAGASANALEKAKGVEVMARLHSARGGKTARVTLADAAPAEAAAFWAALGGSPADVQPAVADDDAGGGGGAAAAGAGAVKLYKVGLDAGGALVSTPIAPGEGGGGGGGGGGRLTRDLLPAGAVALLDAGTSVFVWVSKTAPPAERKSGMALASKFIDAGGRAADVARVTVVREGGETPLFKALFYQWEPPASFNFARGPSTGVAGKAAGAVAVDYAALAAAKAAAGAAAPALPPGGELTQWRVVNTDIVPVEGDGVGAFLAGDSFVVSYAYAAAGAAGKCVAVFYWLGRHSSNLEKGTAALKAVEVADAAKAAGAAASQVRVVQGSEPAFFTALFDGGMVVHAGGAGGALAPAPGAPTGGAHLYHVKGTRPADTRAFEVPPAAASLNSGDCFVLVRPGAPVLAWTGRGANAAEEGAAAKLAARLAAAWGAPGVAAVAEGAEDAAFWAALGGRGEYAAAVPPPAFQAARLFVVSDVSGALRVEEVPAWGQADLADDDVMMLDCGSHVFVWVGRAASPAERAGAAAVAARYVAAGVAAGTHDADVPIVRVEAGAEPPLFTACFEGWDATAVAASEDVYAAKLAALAREKAAERGAVEAAAAARASKAAAGVAALEASLAAARLAGGGGAGAKAALAPAAEAARHADAWAAARASEGAPAGGAPAHEAAAAHKEDALTDAEFLAALKATRADFARLPKWKRDAAKKAAGLF